MPAGVVRPLELCPRTWPCKESQTSSHGPSPPWLLTWVSPPRSGPRPHIQMPSTPPEAAIPCPSLEPRGMCLSLQVCHPKERPSQVPGTGSRPLGAGSLMSQHWKHGSGNQDTGWEWTQSIDQAHSLLGRCTVRQRPRGVPQNAPPRTECYWLVLPWLEPPWAPSGPTAGGMDSLGFEPALCSSLAVQPWVNHLPSLSLSP